MPKACKVSYVNVKECGTTIIHAEGVRLCFSIIRAGEAET
jgi:hypothetical protein